MTHRQVTADGSFAKYDERGAYHWTEIGRHPIRHNAFTAERYRIVASRAALKGARRVLDYGCGDGALLSVLASAAPGVELHGFDLNALGLEHARRALAARRLVATLYGAPEAIPSAAFDCVVCTEVIEHATAPDRMLEHIAQLLKPGGRVVITTPIRLTETPEDVNHVQEWFPSEFAALFPPSRWRVLSHEQVVPCAAVEAYFWRPPLFLRVPVFRLVCNLLSIWFGVNALSWLRLRPRLFMMQVVVAEKV